MSDFLFLESIQKGIKRMTHNANLLATKVQVEGFEDKFLLTKHNIEGSKSSKGFQIEELTKEIFVIIPKSLSLVKN